MSQTSRWADPSTSVENHKWTVIVSPLTVLACKCLNVDSNQQPDTIMSITEGFMGCTEGIRSITLYNIICILHTSLKYIQSDSATKSIILKPLTIVMM